MPSATIVDGIVDFSSPYVRTGCIFDTAIISTILIRAR
jgi:hypothetical protein